VINTFTVLSQPLTLADVCGYISKAMTHPIHMADTTTSDPTGGDPTVVEEAKPKRRRKA
jgi:hypothetical protein